VNLPDFFGYRYVLTVVDEISDEVVVTLLKTKGAEIFLKACKEILQLISARKNKIKIEDLAIRQGGGDFATSSLTNGSLEILEPNNFFKRGASLGKPESRKVISNNLRKSKSDVETC
jgi:hypothetical protein